MDSFTGRKGFANQLVTGIGYEWRAGVADESDAFAGGQPRQDGRPHARRIVIVVGYKWSGDGVNGEQFCRNPRIFGQDRVAVTQNVQSTKCDVAGIADGRCRNE